MTKVAAEVGSTVNNYEILGKLAAGGMAEIFLARSLSEAGVERYVVLKRIMRHRADDAQLVRMFLDEARLAAQLQHANIAQVYDIGKLGDSYFFTMEYVHGETVRSILHRANGSRYPIPINVALAIAAGASAGLQYAHERKGMDGRQLGVVHRDVSPSNLMVSYDGTVKVVDFGIAKATDRLQDTESGTVKGKISYLSPEQCKTGVIDRRSDLFSLGIVLWEMLTTRRLYRRANDFENMSAIVNEPSPPPSTVRPDIPSELDTLCLRLLAKDPGDRYQSAADLLEGLEQIAIRLGMVLSSSAIARLLRELFGMRPEPWINTQMSEAAEGVTVTTGPVAVQHELPKVDALDLQLEAVPDWTHRPSVEGPALDSWSAPMPLVVAPPARHVEIDEDGTVKTPPPTPETVTTPAPALIAQPAPHVVPVPIAQPAPQAMPIVPPAPIAPPAPQAVPIIPQPIAPPPQAVPLIPQPPVLPTGYVTHAPTPAPFPPPVPALTPISDAPTRAEAPVVRRSRAPIILLVSAMAAIAAVIWFVTRSSSGVSATDAAIVATPNPADATEPVPITLEDAEPDVVPEVVIDAAVPTRDRPPRVQPRPDPAAALADMYRANRFGEVVARCATVKRLTGAQSTMCGVAACKTRETANARRWSRTGTRGDVVAACRSMGIELDPPAKPPVAKPTKPRPDAGVDCGADMMGCMH